MDATKAFEAFVVLFRPQKKKATFRAYWSVLADGVLGKLVLRIAARTNEMGCTFLGRLGIRLRFSRSHKASGLVLGEEYFRSFV